jgi:F-type H+-transporting ATPase subunit b
MPTRRVISPLFALLALIILVLGVPGAAAQHAPAAPQHDAAVPAGAQPAAHQEAPAHGSEHAVRDTIARLLNFAILVGVLTYFLKSPIAGFLSARSAQIRQDLVSAADMRTAATAQLEEIRRKLAALPAELSALKVRGEEDVRAEKERITQAAAAERDRLIDQTRREIDMQLRMARRELTEYAAQLAVSVAHERIARSITPDDQLRLVDRYTTQLKEAR